MERIAGAVIVVATNESIPIDIQQMFDACIDAVMDFKNEFESNVEHRDTILSTPMEF